MFHWSLPSKSRSIEPLKMANSGQQNPSTVCGHGLTFWRAKKYCNIYYVCLRSNVVCKKGNSWCKDVPNHIFHLIRSRYLSTDLKDIVDLVIQRNSFFAHSENILIVVITDDREHVRELGLWRILKARQTSTTRSVQQFRLPILHFASADCPEMIDWSAENFTEPPERYFRKRIDEMHQTQQRSCHWIETTHVIPSFWTMRKVSEQCSWGSLRTETAGWVYSCMNQFASKHANLEMKRMSNKY